MLNTTRYGEAKTLLTQNFRCSNDTFAEHYRETYTSPPLPPAWMAAEVMSFGQLLAWMVNLKHRQDKQTIAKPFGLDECVFTSFCWQLKDVRNICTHHGHLWNRRFRNTIKPIQGSLLSWLKQFRRPTNGASITHWPSSTTSWGSWRRKHHGVNVSFS